MRKIYESIITLVVVIILVASMTTTSFGATKYDFMKADGSWSRMEKLWNNGIGKNRVLRDYFSTIATERDVIQMAKSGKFDREKSKFMIENSKGVYKLLQILAAKKLNDENDLSEITDPQIVYITSVIKDPKAQAATNGVEYEMEKALYRGSTLYAFWEMWEEEDGNETLMQQFFIDADKLKKNKKKKR